MKALASASRRKIGLKMGLAAVLVLVLASAAAAQLQNLQGFGPRGYPAKFATGETFGRGFNFCRAMYTSGRREFNGSGWPTDYPDADINFSIRFAELTKARIARDSYSAPEHIVVRLTDDELYQCPYLHIEDVGTIALTDAEIVGLRNYLLKGGFVWADDFWGSFAMNAWISQLSRVLPPAEFPVEDIPADHPIFRSMFEVREVPQVPSIQFWRSSNGGTSERGPDSAVATFKGISDKHGNLMVVMTHNTDVSDSWEREGDDPRFFYNFSPGGYAFGINIVLYALTH
jgi:hypothetical protein